MDEYGDVKVTGKLKQTKFPVARIKRIMQKDDEVGKVAQATPIVISKALELFLSKLVEDTATVSVGRGAKRMEAYHLKYAIETIDSFDFLRELVAATPDPSAGGTIPMHEPSTGAAGALDSDDEGGAPPKKRRGRRKKSEMEVEEDEEGGGEKKKRRGRKKAEAGPGGAEPKKRGRKKAAEADMEAKPWSVATPSSAQQPTFQAKMGDDDQEYDEHENGREEDDEYDEQEGGYTSGGGYASGGGYEGWRR